MNETAQYVAEFLKRHDRDRYLSTLILPEKHRDAVQALFAFSADVAAIPVRVSEPGPGEIRLQWWKDALEGVGHSGGSQNPLASALMQTIEAYELPIKQLIRLIAARRFDLYQDPMPDMPTFEGYAGETNSTLYQFAAMILCDGTLVENGDAAGHLGVAHALVGHVAALGHNAARGRIFLPWSVLSAHGLSEQSLFHGPMLATNNIAMARAGIRRISAKRLLTNASVSSAAHNPPIISRIRSEVSPSASIRIQTATAYRPIGTIVA